MGFYDKFWEMQRGSPYKDGPREEIFKCTECGVETAPEKGWNGEPNPGQCRRGCSCGCSDWRPGRISDGYRRRFDRIFPNAPGAGI